MDLIASLEIFTQTMIALSVLCMIGILKYAFLILAEKKAPLKLITTKPATTGSSSHSIRTQSLTITAITLCTTPFLVRYFFETADHNEHSAINANQNTPQTNPEATRDYLEWQQYPARQRTIRENTQATKPEVLTNPEDPKNNQAAPQTKQAITQITQTDAQTIRTAFRDYTDMTTTLHWLDIIPTYHTTRPANTNQHTQLRASEELSSFITIADFVSRDKLRFILLENQKLRYQINELQNKYLEATMFCPR